MNRKRLLLAALAGLLVLSLTYAFWAMPRQEKAPPRVETSRPAAKQPVAGKKEPPTADRLHLGLLAQEPQPFSGAERDIFRFHGGWAPTTQEVEALMPTTVAAPPPPPPPPPPPTPEQILRGVVTQVTFLGFLDKRGVRTVFLSSGGEVFLVKAGEAFGKDKTLLAREISGRELVIGWVQGPETVRVQLIENEALKPATMTSGAASPVTGNGFRSGGTSIPPRRGLLPPRSPRPMQPPVEQKVIAEEMQPPVEEEDIPAEMQPPDDGAEQGEPPSEEAPAGEGNGN